MQNLFSFRLSFKINISGAVHFCDTRYKKLQENVKIFLLLFSFQHPKTPNCCDILGLELWLPFLGLEPWSCHDLYIRNEPRTPF